jgi:hypothetical protein
LGKIPVLFYTGFEKHLQLDSNYLRNLYGDITPFLMEYTEDEEGNILQMPPNYNSAVWKIDIAADSLIQKEILN